MSDDIAVQAMPLDGALLSDAHLLSEVMPIVDQLADDAAAFLALRDLAERCERAGFVESSLVLYDRCLRFSLTDDEQQATYANLTAACHAAAAATTDPVKRDRHLHDGLYAATAALDPGGCQQERPMCIALAHRSVLLAEVGHHQAALADAHRAQALAVENGMPREQVIASIGEVIARWNGSLDTTVLTLISEIDAVANDLDLHDLLRSVTNVEVDVLWSLDRRDDARAALQRRNEQLHALLHRSSEDRWRHVRVGIDRLRDVAEAEADRLTGLPNRRHLDHWLPELMSDDVPVCIAALNVDGLGYVNQSFGRDAGDLVLQELGVLLERVCRRGDSVTSVGSGEFVMVLRDASPGDARIVLERVRQLIAARSWAGLPADVHVTTSVGATVGSGAENSDALQALAHDALRHAKSAGGDRITFR